MDIEKLKPDVSGWKRIFDHYIKEKENGMPKMTVIIPSYNKGHLLEISLKSFVAQKNVDKELIVVDAGSEDHTLSLLDKYKGHIARVYNVTRHSPPLMINRGISLATGLYLSYLIPGVQYLNESSLSHMALVAHENHNPEVLFSGSYLTNSTFKKIKDAMYKGTEQIEPTFNYYPFNKSWLKRGFIPTAPCSIWYRTDYMIQIKGLSYKSNSLKRAFFDLLCRIYHDEKARVVSTFWSTTAYDRRVQKGILNFRDLYNYFDVIRKHFGIGNALMWIFRDKPTQVLTGTITKLRTFFKES